MGELHVLDSLFYRERVDVGHADSFEFQRVRQCLGQQFRRRTVADPSFGAIREATLDASIYLRAFDKESDAKRRPNPFLKLIFGG